MERPKVAIAGATGFVGHALRVALLDQYEVVGLTRSPTRASMTDADGVVWRHCDLFSMHQVEEALHGVDYAIYLVHSMLPSARLTQADFVDLDLLLADNFARAAEKNGVRQILYLGGIRPNDEHLSRHLESRLEVEATLAGRATPVTSIRAGIIIGPGGSSMTMMINLVRRLPAMILPKWTASESAPVAIQDVVRATRRCLGDEEAFGQSYEIGGPEVMTYREMLDRTGRALKVKRPAVGVPVFSAYLSRRWVSMVTGASDALVGPLIESLRHSVVPESNQLQEWLVKDAVPFDDALGASLDDEGRALPNPRRQIRAGDREKLKEAKTVRSVQRMVMPRQLDARWVAAEYMRWLPRFVWPFLLCRVSHSGVVRFYLRILGICVLELTHAPERSEPDRQLFRITGGVLVRLSSEYQGRFEFREVLRSRWIIAAIHDFQPRLPWYIYNFTQALVHLWVMRGFGRHLLGISAGRNQAVAQNAELLPPESKS
ncbi:MAG: NAD(P)H-binding protein [Myxococcota bacterium]